MRRIDRKMGSVCVVNDEYNYAQCGGKIITYFIEVQASILKLHGWVIAWDVSGQ